MPSQRHTNLCRAAFGYRHVAVTIIILLLTGCGISDGTGLQKLTFQTDQSPVQAFRCFRSSLPVSATFDDGAVENATQQANLHSSDPSVVRVSNGSTTTTPSGTPIPKGTLSPVGQPGDTATITATLDNRSASVEVVIQAARLQLTPPEPAIAEGTRIALRPTAILGNPGQQSIVRADNLVRYSIHEPGASGDSASVDDSLLKIDDAGNAIAGDNGRPVGTSTTLTVTASTDMFNAGMSGPCAAGADSIPLTVRNETIQNLQLVLPADNIPANISQPVFAIGQFSGDFSQDLTRLATFSTGNNTVARLGLHGPTQVTTLPASAGQTTSVQATFDQGLDNNDQTVSAQQSLTVSDETLDSLQIKPADARILPQTALSYQALGTFSSANNNQQRIFDLTRDVFWSLRDQGTGATPDDKAVTIGNAAGSQGLVIARQPGIDPVIVRAQRLTSPDATPPPANALQASTTLAFDAVLDSLTIKDASATDTSTPVVIGVDQAAQLNAIGTSVSGYTQNLTAQVVWHSSDPDVAVVSDSPFSPGRLTPITTGTAQITARYQDVTTTRNVTVQQDPPPAPNPPPTPDPGNNQTPCTLPNPLAPSMCLIP